MRTKVYICHQQTQESTQEAVRDIGQVALQRYEYDFPKSGPPFTREMVTAFACGFHGC